MDSVAIKQIITALAVIANVLLGIIIFTGKRKSATSSLFFALTISLAGAAFANYFSLLPNLSDLTTLFWIRLVMFFGAPIGSIFYLFVRAFPGDKLPIHPIWQKIIISAGAINCVLAFTPLLFSGVTHKESGSISPIPGLGIGLYMAIMIIFLVLGIIILIRNYLKSKGDLKNELKYLIIGLGLTFGSIIFFNVIMVNVFKNSSFMFLAGVFTIFYVYFTGYSIVRYQMFNIKLVAAEISVILISLALLLQVFISASTLESLARALVWVLVSYGGWILIKSILNDIKQKEELAKLANELKKANDDLKELDSEKDNFLSMASHELNSPLAAIKGYLSMIIDEKIGGKLSRKQHQYLDVVYTSAKRLAHLVKDLLNVSRIEQGRIHLVNVETNINDIIKQSAMELSPNIKEAKHKLILNLDEKLPNSWWDLDRINEVVTNLLSNAVKYTDPGGRIEIATQTAHDKILVSISDNGIGIPRESIGRIFGKFEQGNMNRDQRKGTGLGLYIFKNLIELHGGKIWVDSVEGKGTTFFFTLPIHDHKPLDIHEKEGGVLRLK